MGTENVNATAGLWPIWLVVAMFGSALTLASFVKLIHSMFLSRSPSNLREIREVSSLQIVPMVVLAGLCIIFGIFYKLPLNQFIDPALELDSVSGLSMWSSGLATIMILIGIGLGLLIWLIGRFSQQIRIVPTWNCGEIQDNDKLIVPGTHFYKTVSSMNVLKQLYSGQEKGYFDAYDQGGRTGLFLTGMLRWMHSGVLPVYLTWVTLGLLIVLFVVCGIW